MVIDQLCIIIGSRADNRALDPLGMHAGHGRDFWQCGEALQQRGHFGRMIRGEIDALGARIGGQLRLIELLQEF
jgi:hypothetical protein